MMDREFSPRNGEIKKYCSVKIIQKRPDPPGGFAPPPLWHPFERLPRIICTLIRVIAGERAIFHVKKVTCRAKNAENFIHENNAMHRRFASDDISRNL
jgi:hypothetical protein